MASYLYAAEDIPGSYGDDIISVFEERTGVSPEVCSEGSLFMLSSGGSVDQGELKVAFNGYLAEGENEPEALIADRYREKRPGFVEELDGQYRFVLYDTERDRFHASSGKMGRKVLYYSRPGDRFVTSSHLAPMLRHPGIEASPSREGVSDFLQGWSASFGGGQRLIEGVSRLHPGHLLTCSGELEEEMFWDAGREKVDVSDDEAVERLEELLLEAVDTLAGEVDGDLEVFLSGGLDSTLLVSLLRERTERKINSYTWGWEDEHFRPARKMSDRYGTKHAEIENSYSFPGKDEIWFYEEPQTAFLRYPFRELYREHGLRHYWTGLNSQATFPVCLDNVRRLDSLSHLEPVLKHLPTARFKDVVARLNYQAAKGIEVLENENRAEAAVTDWGMRRKDTERLLAMEEGSHLSSKLEEKWSLPRSYQESYSYLQLRARDTARYAYYSQDMEHLDVYGYRPLAEYSYSLPVSQKKNRRLLRRIARGRVPDEVITRGASGWEFVSDRFRETLERNREEYRGAIERLIERGFLDERFTRGNMIPHELPRDKGRVNQMVALYLLERWLEVFVDRDEPWRPVSESR